MRRWFVVVCSVLPACAWTARENRPVWNAFEATCVPATDAAFYATLPLTVPGGFVAVLVDTFVAHPIQVVDDAFNDAADLWRGIDYEHAYYTQTGALPLRVAATPLWFLGSFLGRSCFDLGSEPSPEDIAARASARREREAKARADWRQRCLRALREAREGKIPQLRLPTGSLGESADAELRLAVQAALLDATVALRLEIYRIGCNLRDGTIDWAAVLADPSAVVRYHGLDVLAKDFEVAAELQTTLCADPDPAVREKARERFSR